MEVVALEAKNFKVMALLIADVYNEKQSGELQMQLFNEMKLAPSDYQLLGMFCFPKANR